MLNQRKKILFFSHAVTMAHLARPLKWIEELDPKLYDIYLASDAKFKKMCPKNGVTFLPIKCIDANKFVEIVNNGAPIYDSVTFESHIAEDIRIIEAAKPDLVIGDFRHSLSVSCRLKKIKYINLSNAYWSPEIKMPYPLPEAPIVRLLGETLTKILIGPFIPIILKLNFFKMAFLLRKSFQKAGLHFSDYRQVIIDGDITAYCDTPQLVPLKKINHEVFVGPLVWSTTADLPKWWTNLNPKKKRIFLSMGSSGQAELLPLIIATLAKLDIEILVALAGKNLDISPLPNVYITDFLPLEQACSGSDIVICNGGSPLCHAALSYGVPTIGIICNNDQLLNMAHIEKRQAGKMLRYWNLTPEKLNKAVTEVLENSIFKENSEIIQTEFAAINVSAQLQNIINKVLG